MTENNYGDMNEDEGRRQIGQCVLEERKEREKFHFDDVEKCMGTPSLCP